VFAWAISLTAVIPGAAIHEKLLGIATASTSDGFALTLVRAVMAGWLIALLTWLLASTQDSVAHVVLIWMTTAPIAWLGFRHSIVGSVEALYLVVVGAVPFWQTLVRFIVPAVLGNAIGGVCLVALLNYGQVRHERPPGAS
jgi:formate/nitrite transporter FocA (FNT family)